MRTLVIRDSRISAQPVGPRLQRLANDTIGSEIHDRDVLSNQHPIVKRGESTYSISGSVTGNEVDVKVNHVAGLVRLHVASVIRKLITAAKEGVAVVVTIDIGHRVLDRTGAV